MTKNAIAHYEAALKEAFPRGATGEVFHHWNEARYLIATEALDRMAGNARELGLDSEPVWSGGPTNKDYEDAMRAKGLLKLTAALEQPAQQEIDWKDQYEKQKRRADMWVAKYEADIGPLEKAGPVTAQQEPVCDKDPQGCWSVRCQLGKQCKNTPAQRTWVGLTLEDMETTHWSPDFRAGAKWAAAKLKEKNT